MSHEVAEVLSDTPHRTWEGGERPLYYFMVKLIDGTTAEAGKIKSDTLPKVGDRYENLKQPSPQAPAGAVPTLGKPITDYKGSAGKSYEADPKGLRGKNASSALHAAISLVEATNNTNVTSDAVVALADKLYGFIESKAGVGE